MDIHIVEPKKPPLLHTTALAGFLQKIANRYSLGNMRYGQPHPGRLYLSRLEKELKCYKKTGNIEHLLNVAVYCFLEVVAPEHPESHWNEYEESATRREFGS